MVAIQIDPYTAVIERTCQECGAEYRICDYVDSSPFNFHKPDRYIDGCEQFCLACWLGVGPCDFPDSDSEIPAVPALADLPVIIPHNEFRHGRHEVTFPYDTAYPALCSGSILEGFDWFLQSDWQLAVMPIFRVRCLNPLFFPNGAALYPAHTAAIHELNVVANSSESDNIAEASSAAAGVDRDTFERLPVIVVPCKVDWEDFCGAKHAQHLQLIRDASECIDRSFLDFFRYRRCRLESVDSLPSRAGQVRDNPRMSGLMLFSPVHGQSRIVAGAAFTHTVTDGMGMPARQFEWNEMPLDGEVGAIVNHGLMLYSHLLESPSSTGKFTHAMGLLEYLAEPHEYKRYDKVRPIIVRYLASTKSEHHRLSERFRRDLFGPAGLRTAIVHNGKRLEELMKSPREREDLFKELDGYIRTIINDMVAHSELTWAEYVGHRNSLGYESRQ